MKPQLAADAVLEQMLFDAYGQPKIDGVRALNTTGQLTGRSLDPFEGFGITDYFSKPDFTGFDGEMTLGDVPNDPDRLCARTSGAMGRIYEEGKKVLLTQMADLHWWIFDCLDEHTRKLPYAARWEAAERRVRLLQHPRLHIVPFEVVKDIDAAKAKISAFLDDNYEGAIFRNPNALPKEGRPSKKGQELWRVKPWQDDEMLVTGMTEGERNENEAKTNTLGRTERSSAKAGKVANGVVGNLKGTLLKDIRSSVTGKLLFPAGLAVTVGAGELTAQQRKHYFDNPHEIVGHVVKFKHLAHGTLDLLRMGTYISHRLPADMSN